MSEYVVVTGMSGAGRSTAGATLEDLGWFVIDNMPSSLIPRVAELAEASGSEMERVAFVIGRGGADRPEDVMPAIDELRSRRHHVQVLFLDASNEVLLRRFEGTRRRHPLDAQGVEASIDHERTLLGPLRDHADLVVDTGELNVNQLRSRLIEVFSHPDSASMLQTSIVSFGFKHGLPLDVDLVFDCRFLPNPYWDEALRGFSGLDAPVRDFVLGKEETVAFLDRVEDLLVTLLPAYQREGKSYLTIAMGCTGGRHRSVAIAEALGKRLADRGDPVTVFHRDLER